MPSLKLPVRELLVHDLPLIDPACYEVLSEHARGGFGRILRARDRRTGRMVAIKEVHGDGVERIARFAREARLTAMLQHPAIVPVYEVGRWPSGRPFFAMKLVEGRPLSQIVSLAAGVHDRLRLVPHVLAVAEALAYAHGQGIIHRDLKPQNVLVGPFGETVVIDWGLAKRRGSLDRSAVELKQMSAGPSFATEAGVAMGTPAYMSPEQARGEPVDERADVYGLGALLFHVLLGRPPHDGLSPTEALAHLRTGHPPPLERDLPDLPPELTAIVRKSMMPDPEARYPTGKEMAEDLGRFTSGQMVSAHLYSLGSLVRRWLGRHKAAVSLGAAVLISIAALMTIAFQRSVSESRLADVRRAHAQRAEDVAVANRNDMIFLQAQNWLARDPTAALAWLKQYPPDGPRAGRLGPMVDEALDLGVARHVLRQPSWVAGIDFTADGTGLVGALKNGDVMRWDAATGAPRRLGRFCEVARVSQLSRDRRILAVGGAGGAVELFHLDRQRPAACVRGHGDAIASVAFSDDSRRLVSHAVDQTVRVWDVDGAAPLLSIEEEPVTATALARDGQSVFLALGSGDVVEVNVASGARRAVARLDRPASSLVASPDGVRLAVGWEDRRIRLIHLATGAVEELGVEGGRWMYTFSPSGRILAAATLDGTIRLLDVAGRTVKVLRGHEDAVYRMVFSADDSLLLSSSGDTTARVWNLETGSVRVLRGHEGDVRRAALSPDGTIAATSSADRSIRLWQLRERGREEVAHIAGRISPFEPDGQATTGFDRPRPSLSADGGTILFLRGQAEIEGWHLATGVRRRERLDRHDARYRRVPPAVRGDAGRMVAIPEPGGAVLVWSLDVEARRRVRSETHAEVTALALSSDGRTLVTADTSGHVLAWKLADTRRDRPRVILRNTHAHQLALSPDGSRLAAVLGARLAVFDLATGRPGPSMEVAAAGTSSNDAVEVEFAPDGRSIAWLARPTNILVLWNLTTGRAGSVDIGGEEVASLAFSPDSSRLAFSAFDLTVRVVEVATLETRRFEGHKDHVWGVAWSPDGKRLASYSSDRTIRLWDLGTGEARVLRGHGDSVDAAAFSADGRTLTSASADGTVRRWNLALLPVDRVDVASQRLAAGTSAVIGPAGLPETRPEPAGRSPADRSWAASPGARPVELSRPRRRRTRTRP